jgi:hypothetical protein
MKRVTVRSLPTAAPAYRMKNRLTFDKDDDFVIFNTRCGVPVAESTIKRGFHRTLALIGPISMIPIALS